MAVGSRGLSLTPVGAAERLESPRPACPGDEILTLGFLGARPRGKFLDDTGPRRFGDPVFRRPLFVRKPERVLPAHFGNPFTGSRSKRIYALKQIHSKTPGGTSVAPSAATDRGGDPTRPLAVEEAS